MSTLRQHTKGRHARIAMLASGILAASLALPLPGFAANVPAKASTKVAAVAPALPADNYAEPSQIGPEMSLVMGKSTLLRLPVAIDRISVGDTRVADITLISAKELYLLGKRSGTTNVILWRKGGQTTTIIDVSVAIDVSQLDARLKALFPEEKGITVARAANSIILNGTVSSALKNQRVQDIADAFVRDINRALILPAVHGEETPVTAGGTNVQVSGAVTGGAVQASTSVGGATVINMLQVAEPQQVMLEVKVAEISKTLLDRLGIEMNLKFSAGDIVYQVISRLFDPTTGAIAGGTKVGNGSNLFIHAENNDGLVKILAEPNIVAISGQEGSFLAGGSIFIPVQSGTGLGTTAITLEEKPFGIGLKFLPTVLEGGRINLKVAPEVSDVLPQGVTISSGSITNVLPAFTIRRATTTVQLYDGQSLMIGGLLKNNVREQIKAFPVLGQVPVLGALFRSSEYQKDKTELVFFVTPRLAKPAAPNYPLPTDNFQEPTPAEYFLGGKMEGDPKAPPPAAAPQQNQGQPQGAEPSGFDVK